MASATLERVCKRFGENSVVQMSIWRSRTADLDHLHLFDRKTGDALQRMGSS